MNTRLIATLGGAVLLVATMTACGSKSYNPVSPSSSNQQQSSGDQGQAADITITITGMNAAQSFSPAVQAATTGQTVAWKNGDTIAHTATANNGAFDTGIIAPGATSAPITMGTAGSFLYHCNIHPSMTGTVNVNAPGSSLY